MTPMLIVFNFFSLKQPFLSFFSFDKSFPLTKNSISFAAHKATLIVVIRSYYLRSTSFAKCDENLIIVPQNCLMVNEIGASHFLPKAAECFKVQSCFKFLKFLVRIKSLRASWYVFPLVLFTCSANPRPFLSKIRSFPPLRHLSALMEALSAVHIQLKFRLLFKAKKPIKNLC